jgi:hypothetical protein
MITLAYSVAFVLLREGAGPRRPGQMLRRLGLPGLLRVAVIAFLGLSLLA